jgi:arylformamidase
MTRREMCGRPYTVGLGAGHRTEVKSHAKGDAVTSSDLRFNAHTGTHIDAPRHFVATDPTGVDQLDLRRGPMQ